MSRQGFIGEANPLSLGAFQGKGLSVENHTLSGVYPASPLLLKHTKRAMLPMGEAAKAALGNNAITRTPPLLEPTEAQVKHLIEARQQRYTRQRAVHSVMGRLRRRDRNGELVPYRVMTCMWATQKGTSGVSVVKTTRGATYSGLQICGSVWHCPVCAARITNERRKDISDAIAAARQLGFKPVLVTLTARHHSRTHLKKQLEAMTKAHEGLWRGEPAKRFKARYNVFGFIRNLEVTHSVVSSFHPHIHSIVFVPAELQIEAFAADMRARWQRSAARRGLTMNGHGFDATDADDKVADYLAKFGAEPSEQTLQKWQNGWNEADELTRWHTKKGKGHSQPVRAVDGHYTPWQLLDFAAAGDKEAAKLFRRYAVTFHGRRQLHWSDGLRAALGLKEELTDEEAAQEQQEGQRLLEVYLTKKQWQVVRGNDYRAELLALVERATPDEVRATCLELFGWEPQIIEPGLEADSEDNNSSTCKPRHHVVPCG